MKMHKERKMKRRNNLLRRYMKRAFPALMYGLTYLFCVAMGVLSSMPENVYYEVGGVSKENIVATKDVVDQYSTELLREEAQQKVLPIYYTDESIVQQIEEKILSVFSACEQVRQAAAGRYAVLYPEAGGSFRRGLGKRLKGRHFGHDAVDAGLYHGAEHLYHRCNEWTIPRKVA